MLKVLSGFPDNVLAVEGYGEVTAADYKTLLVPVALAKMKTHPKPPPTFFILGSEFTRLSAGAMWEDAKLGVGHWRDWGRIAVVTDVLWVRRMPCDCLKTLVPSSDLARSVTMSYVTLKTWTALNRSKTA